MKKTMKYFWLLAATAVIFSCQKETGDAPEQQPANDTEEQTSPSDPGIHTLDPDEYLVGFSASLEGIESKVSIDVEEGSLSFEDGDAVLVVTESKSGKYVYNATDAVFEPEDTDQAVPVGNAKAYYPYSEFSAEGETVTFTMPEAVAAGSAEDLGDKTPMAALISSERVAQFKNLCSVFRVRLTGNKSESRRVSWVQIENDNVPLAPTGYYTVSWSDNVPSVAVNAATNCSVTIVPENGLTLDADTPTDFFFLFPPTETSMTNMLVTVKMDGTESTYSTDRFTRTRNGALALSSNKIITLAFRAGYFYDGDGSESHPYQIKTAEDFRRISVNESFWDKHFVQVADINFNGASLTPIGVFNTSAPDRKPFTGVYNGEYNNSKHTLSNFVIQSDKQGTGLFSAIQGATLENISIINPKVTVNHSYVGGLVGWLSGGTLSGCSISGSNGFVKSSGGATGGLVGYVYNGGIISNCTVSDIVVSHTGTPSGNNDGGIVGYVHSSGVLEITDCHLLSGSISSGPNHGQVGGIIGSSQIQGLKGLDSQYLYVSGCTNAASINPGSRGYSGGIIGIMNGGTITDCKNNGNINNSRNFAGGIVGYAPSVNTSSIGKGVEIINCLSYATIKGNNRTGGIIGFLGWGIIQRCTSKGSVTGAQSVGGIIGEAQVGVITSDGTDNGSARVAVLECLAMANVTTTKGVDAYTGGVVGYLHSSFKDNNCAFATVGSCAGWNNINNSANAGCSHLGGFVGYVSTAVADVANNNRVRMYYCYTTAAVSSGSISNAPSKFGGFVGYLERGNTTYCYYTQDTGFQEATASTNNFNINHLEKKNAADISFTTAQKLGPQNISNGREGYYSSSDWTTTGKNGEALSGPLPSALVNLGEDYYR